MSKPRKSLQRKSGRHLLLHLRKAILRCVREAREGVVDFNVDLEVILLGHRLRDGLAGELRVKVFEVKLARLREFRNREDVRMGN